jgi:hypothetical protein
MLCSVLLLVLEVIQYSNPAHWSASSREPLGSTIVIAAAQTAIDYEHEHRFTEHEHDKLRCEVRTV